MTKSIIFNVNNFPAQCAAGIISDIFLSPVAPTVPSKLNWRSINIEDLKTELNNICNHYDYNVIYLTHYELKYLQPFIDIGCIAIDSNFNNNSGNTFIMLKYVYEK